MRHLTKQCPPTHPLTLSFSTAIALVLVGTLLCSGMAFAQSHYIMPPGNAPGPDNKSADPERSDVTCDFVNGNILLDFEGLGNVQAVGDAYAECGVTFETAALSIIDADAGGGGNFANEPSPETTLFFLDRDRARLNYPNGFTGGFSFYYSAINLPGVVRVYSGVNGTGEVLKELTLPVTPRRFEGDPTGDYDNFQQIGVEFDGVARSVDFGGTANRIAYDNITLGTADPEETQPARLEFATIPDQRNDEFFPVTLRAVDGRGNVVESFAARTTLQSATGDIVRTEDGEPVVWNNGIWTGRVKLETPTTAQQLIAVAQPVGRTISGTSNFFEIGGSSCTGRISYFSGLDPKRPNIDLTLREFDDLSRVDSTSVEWIPAPGSPEIARGFAEFEVPPGRYVIFGMLESEEARLPMNPAEVRVACNQHVLSPLKPFLDPDKPTLLMVPGITESTSVSSSFDIVPKLPRTYALQDELVYANPLGPLGPVSRDYFKELMSARYNVVEVPWDWRMPTRATGEAAITTPTRYLQRRMDLLDFAFGRSQTYDVLAHSMGGLVARALIQSDDYAGRIARLVTLGTPHSGSTDAYFTAEGGHPEFVDELKAPYWQRILDLTTPEWAITQFLERTESTVAYEYETNAYPNSRFSSTSHSEVRRFLLGYAPTLFELFPDYPFLQDDIGAPIREASRTKNTFLLDLNSDTDLRRFVDPDIFSDPATRPERCKDDYCVPLHAIVSRDEPAFFTVYVGPEDPQRGYYPSGKPRKPNLFTPPVTEDSGDGTVLSFSAGGPFDEPLVKRHVGDYGGHAGLLKGAQDPLCEIFLDGACPKLKQPDRQPDTPKLLGSLRVSVSGHAQPLLITPTGARIGVAPDDGEIVTEIPSAELDLTQLFSAVRIPEPIAGEYELILSGPVSEPVQVRVETFPHDAEQRSILKETVVYRPGQPTSFIIDLPGAKASSVGLKTRIEEPEGLSATNQNGRVQLTWTAPEGAKISAYRIYRRFESQQFFTQIAELDGDVGTYLADDPWLSAEGVERRFFAVTAVRESDLGESALSNVVTNVNEINAEFDWNIVERKPLTVEFVDRSKGSIDVLEWDFDSDGGVDSSAPSPTHVYSEGDSFLVTLTVSGPLGSDMETARIELQNAAPIADAGTDQTVECTGPQGTTVGLDGTGSTDPDGDDLTCSWTSSSCSFVDATACVTDATCPRGENPVSLTVSDGELQSAADTVRITVQDTTPPEGSISYPSTGACLSPPVTVEDNFTDVCDDSLTRTYDPIPGPTYTEDGSVDLLLVVEDDAGNTAMDETSFVVDGTAPVVTLLGLPDMRQSVPRQQALGAYFQSSDDDAAPGQVVRERLKIDGCVVYDGSSYGDGDGLLSDESVGVVKPMICDVYRACGKTQFVNSVIEIEAEDCAGNAGSAEATLSGRYVVDPGGC